MKKKRNGWKIAFFIVLTLFVLENALFIWGLDQSYKAENECRVNICNTLFGPDYQYNFETGECKCYNEEGTLTRTWVIR